LRLQKLEQKRARHMSPPPGCLPLNESDEKTPHQFESPPAAKSRAAKRAKTGSPSVT
jgi:hypothetical protein